MIFFLRKEFNDFFHNYKSWLSLVIAAGAPRIFQLFDKELGGYPFIICILIAVCQYLYDSFLTDTTEKGMIFILNSGRSFMTLMFVKVVMGILMMIVSLVVNFDLFLETLKAIDFLWLLPLCIAITSLMLLTAMMSQGSELTSFTVSAVVILGSVTSLLLLPLSLMRAGATMAAAIILVRLAYRSFNSLRYRTQL